MPCPAHPTSDVATSKSVPIMDCRSVHMTSFLGPCAGRSRQWLGAVPAAGVWAARQSLPLR